MAGYGNNALFLQTLQGLGVPLDTAIGAMGSLGWESGVQLNNQALNRGDAGPGNHSYGWGQWNRERARALFAEGQRQGQPWYAPSVQAAHIRNELTGPYAHVLNKLRSSNSIGAGADIWTRDYEVPKVVNSGARANRGIQIANAMGLPVSGAASYPENLSAMAASAATLAPTASPGMPPPGNLSPPQDPSSVGGMLAGAVDPAWTPPPVAPMQGVDFAGISGLGGSSPTDAGGASGGASGGFQPDSLQDPYGDQELVQRVDALDQLPTGAVPADQIGARYAKAKMAGGPLAETNLADLFQIKTIGQGKSLRKPSQTV